MVSLRVGGRVVRTTAEHPFWVQGDGWRPVRELRPGHVLVGHDGRPVAVEEVRDTGEWAAVYNLRVADSHTYFVGSPEWDFSVWAHNADCTILFKQDDKRVLHSQVTGRTITEGTEAQVHAFAQKYCVDPTLFQGVIRAMLIQKLRLAVVVLAASVGVALAGGVALWARPGDPPAGSDGGANAPLPANGVAAGQDKGDAPKGQVDETARKEIEALRKRVEALEGMQKPPAAQSQKVVVTSPLAKDVAIARQYVARILAHHHVNASALADGVITEVAVKEGQAVKKGDVLFKVLPDLYQAKLDAETAEVHVARLEFNTAKKQFDNKVVSKEELTLFEAKLAKAQAKAKLAETELGFTTVRAPFDGLLGRQQQQVGSLVKWGDAFTTLSDTSRIWVYFNVPELRYLEYKADGDRVKVGTPVDLVLADGDKFPEVGKIGAIEAGFENDTGNISFRADFPNPKGLLRHGQTGKVLIHESLRDAIVIPQRATFEVLDKRYVFVVGNDDVARRREIAVRNEMEDLFVVRKGLDVSDRIVVEGVRQVRDGEKVVGYEYRKPEEVVGNAKKHEER